MDIIDNTFLAGLGKAQGAIWVGSGHCTVNQNHISTRGYYGIRNHGKYGGTTVTNENKLDGYTLFGGYNSQCGKWPCGWLNFGQKGNPGHNCINSPNLGKGGYDLYNYPYYPSNPLMYAEYNDWSAHPRVVNYDIAPVDTIWCEQLYAKRLAHQSTHPKRFALYQNYPNPFNASTLIEFELPEPSDVTLDVYNLLGQIIYENRWENLPEGKHKISWNIGCAKIPSGLYFYRISTEEYTETKTMVLLK